MHLLLGGRLRYLDSFANLSVTSGAMAVGQWTVYILPGESSAVHE